MNGRKTAIFSFGSRGAIQPRVVLTSTSREDIPRTTGWRRGVGGPPFRRIASTVVRTRGDRLGEGGVQCRIPGLDLFPGIGQDGEPAGERS